MLFCNNLLQNIMDAKIVAGYTANDPDDAVSIAKALYDGGIKVIEFTLRTESSLEGMKKICSSVPDIIKGIGTILNALIIASAIDISLPYLPKPEVFELKIIQACIGILVVGIGSGIYLTCNLGPGPRDGLMIGLQRVTNFSLPGIRTLIEFSAVISGWLLGGIVGIGTILFVIGIGPCVGLGLSLLEKYSKDS